MKGIRQTEILTFFFFLISINFGQSQSEIETYLTEIAKLKSFSGTVLISIKDKVILNKGFGMANYEHHIPNTSNSVHRLASLTKPFTAMGILKLLEQHDSLSLNASLGNIFKTLPESWKAVTIFHLLTHTSGIPNHFGDLDAVPVEETFEEIEKVFKLEKDSQLKSTPGETYRYNNFGYVLLGRIIEVVSSKLYSDYLKEYIFDPLAMNHTKYDDPRTIIEYRSEGYKIGKLGLQNDALKDPAAYAAGGLLSTTDDLLKWSKALKANLILSQDSRKQMFTPFKSNYGLGWQIVQKKGKTMYNHNGSSHGYDTRIVFYPKENIFIAVLGNNEDLRAAAITCDIEGLIFNQLEHILSLPIKLSKDKLIAFAGNYTSEKDNKRSIQLRGHQLMYINENSAYELMPISKTEFCFKNYEDIRLTFFENHSFEITSCSLNPKIYLKKARTELVKAWQTKTKFESPESVIYDAKRAHIYVSNGIGYAKNGEGFISRLSKSGEVLDLKWIAGLNRPTGMAIFEDKLFVADIDVLRVIDLLNGKVVQQFKVAAQNPMLNDVAITKEGKIYVTASGNHSVYQLENGELTQIYQNDKLLKYANGIVAKAEKITVAGWDMALMRPDSKKIAPFALQPALTDFDGLVLDKDNQLFCTQVGEGGKLWQIDSFGNTNLIYQQPNYLADFDIAEIDGQKYFLMTSGNHKEKVFEIIALK